jgi:PAS domain S-box-containing protein
MAFTLHPDLENMVFISPGLRSRHLIESMVADYRPELELSIWHYETLADIERALSLLPKNSVLMPVGEPVTVGGVAMPMNKFVARIALEILHGELVAGETVSSNSPSRFMFDYKQLQRFGVDMGLLLPDSIVVNRPTTLYAQHKRAEGSLRTNQERFWDFAESVADWFWEADADARFTYISRRAQEVLGVPVSDLSSLPMEDVFSDSEQQIDGVTKRAAKVSKDVSFQLQSFWRRPDGVRRVIITSGKPIRTVEGELLGYRGTSRGISDSYSLTEELGYQASHDTLTNLLNCRAFEQRLQTL